MAVIDQGAQRARFTQHPDGTRPPKTLLEQWAPLLWRLTMLTISGVVLILSLKGIKFQDDFNGDLYVAGTRILHGITPYSLSLLDHQASIIQAGGTLHSSVSPRWPAPILVAGVPLALLPVQVADVLFLAICVASVIFGLRLLGVRDSRCVLVALVSCPTVIGVMLGNLSPLILLGVAAAWRLRPRAVAPALAIASVVLAKLFVWPLAAWLLVTRRKKTLVVGFVAGTVALIVGWAVIGFSGMLTYPNLIIDVARIGEPRGCSLVAFLMYLGMPITVARVIALSCGLLLMFLAWKMTRRPNGDAYALGLVVMAALTATPVVWSHYLVLLFIPIALLSPTLSWMWFLPALGAFAPTGAAHSYGMAILPVLVAESAVILALCQPLLRQPAQRYWRSIVAMANAAMPS